MMKASSGRTAMVGEPFDTVRNGTSTKREAKLEYQKREQVINSGLPLRKACHAAATLDCPDSFELVVWSCHHA